VIEERVRFSCPRCGKRYKTPRTRFEPGGGRLGVLCSGCQSRLRVLLEESGARAELLEDAVGPGDVHHHDIEEDVAEAGEVSHGHAHAHAHAHGHPHLPSPGEKVGRYQIESLAGRGGMGAVYKAFDPTGNRSVALKVLPRSAAPEAAARFQREIEVQGNIHHPNLMPIFDSGESDGFRWYTMELLREPLSLRDLTLLAHSGESARSPRLKAVASLEGLIRHVLIPVARAIHHANLKEGVLHRDLTPYNVLVDAMGLRPYVIDFGVCTLLERKNPALLNVPLETSPVIDGQRTVTGTLVFMPPEQLRGQSDRRGDVWALGALLHAAVTGEAPLAPAAKAVVGKAARLEGLKLLIEQAHREGNAEEEAGFRESLLALQEGRDRTPADLHKDILRGTYEPRPPWIHPALDAVIAKAMAVDPDDRYRNAKELADDLEAWLDGDAVEALAEKQNGVGRVLYRARLGFQRHRGWITVVAAVALVGGAIAFWPKGESGPPVPERQAAAEKAYRAAMDPLRLSSRDADPAGPLLGKWIAVDPEDPKPWQAYKEVVARREAEKVARQKGTLLDALAEAEKLGDPAGIESATAALAAYARLVDDKDLLVRARGFKTVAFFGRSGQVSVRRVEADGHVGPSQPFTGTLEPGRWVAVSSAQGRDVFVPVDVLRSGDRLTVEVPVEPTGAPEGTVFVSGGRVKGPLGESQVPALFWERTEVTVERYGAWLATLPAEEQAQRVPRVAGAFGEAPRPLWEKRDGKFVPPKNLAGLAPVDGISLYDARAFASAQGRRLPTAQEWAWAATGPFAAPTAVGSLDALFRLPLGVGPDVRTPSDVDAFPEDVSPFGLRGMAGNVAEWTGSLATLGGTSGWLVMGSGYGLPPERAIVTRAVPEPGWKPLPGVGFRCVLSVP
jgi:serine/threonine protein kinase